MIFHALEAAKEGGKGRSTVVERPQPVEKPGICVKHKPGFLRIAAKEG